MQSQKTIKREAILEGIGLQTGKPCRATLLPSEVNRGVNFIRADLPGKPEVNVRGFLESRVKAAGAQRRSTVAMENVEVQTVEHLMAALWALSIGNIKVEIDSVELPGLDGSAIDFFNALKNAGLAVQGALQKVIEIKDVIWCEEEDSFLGIFPSPTFKISYVLDHQSTSIGRQCVSFDMDEKTFEKEIAPARTFCLKKEAETLLRMGFGKGANLKNTLVMDEGGPIGNELRFPDECARHKVLDLVGDLYLLGSPIRGRVIAVRSGHRLNLELVKKIQEKYGQ